MNTQSEIFKISNRVNLLEVKHGEFSVMQSYMNSKLEAMEKLLRDNQASLTNLNSQFLLRNARIKTVKSTVVALVALTSVISGLHFQQIKALLETWFL